MYNRTCHSDRDICATKWFHSDQVLVNHGSITWRTLATIRCFSRDTKPVGSAQLGPKHDIVSMHMPQDVRMWCVLRHVGSVGKNRSIYNFKKVTWLPLRVRRGRPAGVILSCVCLCHRAASCNYLCPHKRIVTITKVYIARNTIHVEIIRLHTN